jgi:type IV pilus assembly protein PilC
MPAPAKMLIDLSTKMKEYWTFLMLGVLAVLGLSYLYIRTPKGRAKWDSVVLRLPLIGRVVHLSELSRLCRSMSLLFRAGLPLTEILPLLVQSSRNQAISKALSEVQQDMIKGEGISKPMTKNELFLPMMAQMVRVGEESGNLDATLLSVARSYDADVDDKTRSLISLIQPAMTLAIGVIIAGIALSLVSAMYSIYGQGI